MNKKQKKMVKDQLTKIVFSRVLLLSVLCVTLSLCFASCSDDDAPATKPVDEEIVEKGIFSYAKNCTVEIPIKASGAWTATTNEDCDWITLLDESGKGATTLVAVLDDNFTDVMRSAIVTVESAGEKSDIKISQYATLDGQEADNGDSDYLQTVATHKLGAGCNLVEYYDNPKLGIVYKRNSVFNLASLDSLMATKNPDYAGLVTTIPVPSVNFQQAKMDTICDKRDALTVSLELSVSYGKFNFGISGGYHGNEDLKSHVMKLAYGAEYPTLDANLSYMDAIAHNSAYNLEETHAPKDYRKSIFSTGLALAKRNIEQAKNENAKKTYIRQLINNYGTGVVVGTQLGGRITLDLDMDSLYICETMGVDNAKVTAGFKLGLFNLDAKIEVDYQKSSIDVLQHSAFRVECAGGDIAKANAVVNELTKPRYDTTLPSLIGEWAKSITNNTDPALSNADLIKIYVIPIWEIFTDFDDQQDIMDYIKSIHRDSKFMQNYENGAFDGEINAPSKSRGYTNIIL